MIIPMYSNDSDIAAAAEVLKAGRLVVFPTETVYGLGADALNPEAVGRVFAAKGRPADNPLIVHLAEVSDIGRVVSEVNLMARRLFEEFAPGPLTVVLPARADLPRTVTAGLDTVAVRIPGHPVARQLLRAVGTPVAAPSANRSGEPSPTTVEMAIASLGDGADTYLDGGPCTVGLESTVLSVERDTIRILRPGAITEVDILSILPDARVQYGAPVGDGGNTAGRGAQSPGLRHRHYRPHAEVLLWEHPSQLRKLTAHLASSGHPVMVIAPESMKVSIQESFRLESYRAVVRTYSDHDEYARRLYAWFTESDDAGAFQILAHLPSGEGIGVALRDRLTRASGTD